LDVFRVFAQSTNGDGEALVNWINPGTYDATAYNSPAFTALEGVTGDGSATYIGNNWIPATHGINHKQDDAHIAIYIRNNIDGNKRAFGAKGGSNNASQIALRASGQTYISLNTLNSLDNGANADSRGMFIINRTASNVHDCYRNKVQIVNGTDVSSGLPSVELYILGLNNNGGLGFVCTNQASMVTAGGGLTQTNIDNLTDNFEVYMDSNSKGVIS
ncbi:unnamed protein product, partial [marine sediment metagenome]